MIQIVVDKAEMVPGQKSIFVQFDFNRNILAIVRQFEPRFYHKQTREWEMPYTSLEKLENTLELAGFKFKTEYAIEEEFDFEFKTAPFPHQLEFYLWGKNRDKLFLGDEQGLGKTKQTIDMAVYKKQKLGYNHCLIVVGVNGLKYNWQAEVEKHSDEKAIILGERIITKGPNKGKMRDGSIEERLEDLQSMPDEYFWIINIESLRDEKVRKLIRDYCQKDIISMCIADEIHKMKNPTCQQGKGFVKFVTSKDKIALTGTPLLNAPTDVFIILKWLGIEEHSWTDFKNHHCIFNNFWQITGYKNLNEIKAMLREVMLRRLKSEVLDLPEKICSIEYVTMGEKQSKIYNEVLTATKQNIDKIKLSSNPLAQLTRLRQVTGHTGIVSSTVEVSAKFDRLLEIANDVYQNNDKLVVFSEWTEITNRLYPLMRDYHPVLVTGETKQSERKGLIDTFQENDKCRVIIGTTGALGTGWTLTAAQTGVHLDSPWCRAIKDQDDDRLHRIGTKGTVNILTLVCKDTIDEKIEKLVEQKGEMSDMLVDGKVMGGRASELIDWLLL